VGTFSLKSVLLARHGQHVALVHFPIALFLVGVFFDVVARRIHRGAMATVAFYNIAVAGLFVVPTLVSGILAWKWQLEGQRLHGALLLHLALGCASGILILVTAWLQIRARHSSGKFLPEIRFPVELVTSVLVVATAHLGGIVSGVNGPG
jgi:uncharacterized membrane protein